MADVERAATLARAAFPLYKAQSGRERARFLRAIADKLDGARDAIVERGSLETALPAARVTGELGRTCLQLRLFADLIEEGSWVEARIDHGDEARQPAPKPDLRSMLRPIGPRGCVWRQQFSARLFGRGRRYGLGAGRRLSGHRQGASGASGDAIVHGDPFPLTSNGQSTSVGTRAIVRFMRPVCFQNFPDAALLAELQHANPLGIGRCLESERYRFGAVRAAAMGARFDR